MWVSSVNDFSCFSCAQILTSPYAVHSFSDSFILAKYTYCVIVPCLNTCYPLLYLPLFAQGVNVRERIVEFHRKFYSASAMALVILGREPVSTLREWAVDKFSAVNNNGVSPRVQQSHPYTTCAGVQQWMLPVKDSRSVSITWALPDTRARFQTKSDSYLSHLVGHEGPGSILSHLKARGWATGLNAGTNDAERGYSLFCERELSCQRVLAALFDSLQRFFPHAPRSLRSGHCSPYSRGTCEYG
jgi:secreted Zn-dependent insulinase-like peptidase